MKKDYLKPEMEVMEITVESMIATSNNIGEGDPDRPLDTNNRRGGWGDLWN